MTILGSASHAPVAVFAYNRRDHLEAMFASLMLCDGFAETPITIFVDGPRSERDKSKVVAVRAFVSALGLPNLSYVFREQNMGLRRSVCAGVSQMCGSFGRTIVLEDDFELSPGVLKYFNDALEKYQDRPEIWSVCAYLPDVPSLRQCGTALFLPTTHTLGWATWQRAWQTFDPDAAIDPNVYKSRAFRERFNMHGLRDYATMLEYALAGKIDSWFIRWNYHVCLRNGLSVFPPRPMLKHNGSDGGTHASKLNVFRYLQRDVEIGFYDFKLPDELVIDMFAIDDVVKSHEAKINRWVLLFGRLKRLLK